LRGVIAAAVFSFGTNLCAESDTDTDTGGIPAVIPEMPSGGELDTEVYTDTDTDTDTGIAVMTPDGRRVLLMDDHTWKYIEIEQGLPSESALMEVVNIKELSNACRVGLRVTNNLGYFIKSLVPSFSAYNHDGVLYETVSKAFSSIKPTRDQYRQIQFTGLHCRDVGHVLVHGAEHCHMGELDKFNEEPGECLARIHVQASDLIRISK
jgi:hypothetical protein